jgi:gas vesicle protein
MTRGVIDPKTKIKERTDMATESSEELSTQAVDTATGAAVEVAEAVTDPAGSATRQVRRLERAGAPVNRRLEGQVRRVAERAADTTAKLLDGSLTERFVVRGLRLVKEQARREDLVGLAAYRSLELLHGGFGNAARSLSRFQDASHPPARPTEGRRVQTRSGSRAQASTRKPAANGGSRTRTEARTSTRAARTNRAPRRTSGPAGKTA